MSRIKQIAAHLYQGALRHVAEDGIPDAVDTVLLMAPEAERIMLPLGREVAFIYFPIADDPAGTEPQLFTDLRVIVRTLRGRTVLTICHMGENRSGLMSALILYELYGYKGSSAVKAVQAYGPCNSSNAPHALWNPGFVRQLQALDEPAS